MDATVITISFPKQELFDRVSDNSAHAATVMGEAFDTLTLSEDEHSFFDSYIEIALLSLTPLFRRIIADDTNIINDGTTIGFTFLPRVEGIGEWSQTDLEYIKALSKEWIVARLSLYWATTKSFVPQVERWTASLAQTEADLKAALHRFYRPCTTRAYSIQ